MSDIPAAYHQYLVSTPNHTLKMILCKTNLFPPAPAYIATQENMSGTLAGFYTLPGHDNHFDIEYSEPVHEVISIYLYSWLNPQYPAGISFRP